MIKILLFFLPFIHCCAVNNEDIVFVILTHVKDEKQNELWKKCYSSIRTFYPETPVVIIDDNSPYPVSYEGLHNTSILHSEYPGAGELLPYYYFLKYEWAQKMVFLHDSMYLNRKFAPNILETEIKFHWWFIQPYGWDGRVKELLSVLSNSKELITFFERRPWSGCFGVASTIDLEVLKKVESKYEFTSILVNYVKTRRDREALERIFGVIMFKEGYVNRHTCSNFGPYDRILHSPGADPINKEFFGR